MGAVYSRTLYQAELPRVYFRGLSFRVLRL